MWKRDEAVRPASQPPAAPQPPAPVAAAVSGPRPETSHQMEKDIVNIGKSVVIKGELNGSEDLTIEGHVEGTIQLKDNVLTIGDNGSVDGDIIAPRVAIAEGAHFRGSVDMQRKGGPGQPAKPAEPKPQAQPQRVGA